MRSKITVLGIFFSVFAFVLPFAFSRNIFSTAVNSKYLLILFSAAFLCLVAAAAFFFREEKIIWRRRWLLLGLLTLLLVHYLAAFFGASFIVSFWSDLLRSSGLLFLTAVAVLAFLAGEFLREGDWMWVRRAVTLSGGLFSALTIVGAEGLNYTGRIFVVDFGIQGLTLGNSTFAGAYLVLSLMFTLIELFKTEPGSKWRKWLKVLLALQFFSPLLINLRSIFDFTSSPANLLGSARASSATAIILSLFLIGRYLINRFWPLQRRVSHHGIWIGLFLVGIIGSVFLLFTPSSFVQEEYIRQSSAARIVVWESGLKAFKEHPWLGWGPENFRQAFERNFDNRLYLQEYQGEIWFDRAHNILVDTLVSIGLLGLIVWIGVAFVFILTVWRSKKAGIIGEWEAVLLASIPLAHFLQLQTGFDTVGTYGLGGLILGYGLWLERQIYYQKENSKKSKSAEKATVILLLVVVSIIYFYFGGVEVKRQTALFDLFQVKNQARQLSLAEEALGGTNFEILRLAYASMIKGVLGQIALDKNNPKLVTNALEQLTFFEGKFKDYLTLVPNDYRARMNYSYLLLTKTVLGDDRLVDAQAVIRESYHLSAANPLTYALDALAELYSGNITAAKLKIKEGIDLSPAAEFSQQVLSHIEEQESKFPTVSVLKLENL